MDPTEREDSSNYGTSPVQNNSVAARPDEPIRGEGQPYAPKPKKSRTSVVLAGLLLLALIGAAVLGWKAYDQSNLASTLTNKVESKDKQITRLTSQLSQAQEAADTRGVDEVKTDTSSVSSDSLIEQALAYSKAKVANQGYPSSATDLTAEIDKQTAAFARVQVGSSTAGPGVDLVYFKKDGSGWMLLGDDNNNPDRFRQTFGMPSDF